MRGFTEAKQLGPTFIKLGQLSSTRSDLFPREFVDELVKLQDMVPAFSREKARKFIESELGASIDMLFKEFEDRPIASASLGQVHRAILHNGEKVVVKVQRPGLKKLFDIDLKNLKLIAEYFQRNEAFGGPLRDWIGIYEECATDLQGTVLDSHALILQPCHVKNDAQKQKTIEKDKSSTKLLVRNVAFEATEKDLRRLFSPFGQIKSLRLPMKFGSHRGFAFVEYVTQQEAQNALKALSSTHLYGRHLVKRAKEGESLEELLARTASQFSDNNNGFQAIKLSKKRKDVDILDEGKMKFGRFDD
ncbi:Protein ACTIVITY OF BC1 COMPLEX KINASE 7 [Vigna angularis]|uniref:Protein ACTIVITY OF BC1 COMPLEX KINASE 7 n=1 Tax=Phaseolus angularis TaxID=3914 RepID=A0A8T0L0S6_PHAAN|nr:Protein ACTIVITY OF BC1 COMPLEX KINASE 7 [Vigna angularis]